MNRACARFARRGRTYGWGNYSSASTINVNVKWHATNGYRLMDMSLMSNQPVPVRSQEVTVALLDAGGATLGTATTTNTDDSGAVSVANNASATQVRVTDRFGNTATAPIH